MKVQSWPRIAVPSELVEAIRSFPTRRETEHCGNRLRTSPFDFSVTCPHCGARIKLRSFSGVPEIEDVFDAVFEWMSQPEAQELVKQRLAEMEADKDE